LPALGYSIVYPAWMLAPTIAFLVVPMLNDIVFHTGRMNPIKLLGYLLGCMVLYGSMLLVSLRSSIKSAFGKSTFIVTPKEDQHTSLRQAVWMNKAEIMFGLALAGISLWLTHSVLPVVLIVAPAMLCWFLARRHTKRVRVAASVARHAAPEPTNIPRQTRPADETVLIRLPVSGGFR
jgi:hypothetical protein